MVNKAKKHKQSKTINFSIASENNGKSCKEK